jgi:hypothetical protein
LDARSQTFHELGRETGNAYAQAREGDVVSRGASVLLAALGGVPCAAALIVGFIALTKK